MAPEIRQRKVRRYINDFASTTDEVPEAVFAFTLDEIAALESWVPSSDGFHSEVVDAIRELERLKEIKNGHTS